MTAEKAFSKAVEAAAREMEMARTQAARARSYKRQTLDAMMARVEYEAMEHALLGITNMTLAMQR